MHDLLYVNFYYYLVVYPIEIVQPCNPSPCGTNAICREQNGAGSCACIQNYYGDPYIGCRPECIQNSDCPYDKACFNTKCVNPCPGTCGQNAVCNVVNHVPICTCISGFTGNALVNCNRVPNSKTNPYALITKQLCNIIMTLQLNTLNLNILVVHLLADRSVFVVKLITVQFVLVNQVTLVDHQIVGPNVRQAQNVLEINLV